MSTEAIDIVIREDGSRVVKRTLDDIGAAAEKAGLKFDALSGRFRNMQGKFASSGQIPAELKKMTDSMHGLNKETVKTASAVNLLKSAFIALGGAALVGSVLHEADAYKNLQNRIRNVTDSTDEMNAVTDRVFEIANRTRQGVEGVGVLYARTASSAKKLGVSQGQVLGFTEQLSKAIALSGASAVEANQGILQLAQGMAAGKLQGQDLKAALHDIPGLGDLIARGMGKSTTELRKLGEEGKITPKAIIQAFENMRTEIDDKFAKSVPTLSQAFTVLRNQFQKFVGEADKSTGITAMLSQGVIALSKHIPELVAGLLAVGSAMAVAFGVNYIQKAALAARALATALALNPFLAAAAAIAAATTALVLFRNEIIIVEKGSISLGDYMSALWDMIKDGAKVAASYFKDVLGDAVETFQTSIIMLTLVFGDLFKELKRFTNDALNSLATLSRVASSLANFKGIARGDSLSKLGDELMKAFTQHANTDIVGEIGKEAENMLDNLTKRAAKIALERHKNEKVTAVDLDKKTKGERGGHGDDDDKAAKKRADEFKRLTADIHALEDALDPTTAAMRQMIEAENLLEKATNKGLVTQEGKVIMLKQIREKYQDQLDPIGAYNEELDTEIRLLGMSTAARELEIKALEVEKRLKAAGASDEEIADLNVRKGLRAKDEQIKVNEKANELAQERARIHEQLGGKQEKFAKTQLALIEQFQAENGSVVDLNKALIDLKIEAGNATFGEAFLGQLEVMGDGMDRFTIRAAGQFASFTDSMVDGFADATARSIVFGESLSENLGQAAQQALAGLISGLIKLGTQMLINSALTQTLSSAALTSSIAQASTLALAWAPAEAGASLATVGTNSAAAIAGMTAAHAAAKGLAVTALRTGGDFTVGGAGGPDSQLVAFRATPGEKVHVNTPAQARAAETTKTDVHVPIRVVNIVDPSQMVSAMRSSEGERIILNTIENNPSVIRRFVNG